jgi:hypothetical protein
LIFLANNSAFFCIFAFFRSTDLIAFSLAVWMYVLVRSNLAGSSVNFSVIDFAFCSAISFFFNKRSCRSFALIKFCSDFCLSNSACFA